MIRHVKGVLFADYVRMIRRHKDGEFNRWLLPEDERFLIQRIEPERWYPMATFERLGNAILAVIARDDLEAVRAWGRFSVDQLRAANPQLLAEGDPIETLTRFRVLRAGYFDFDTLSIPLLLDDQAHVVITYHMGMPAEEAASMQTLGFFERLLEISGAGAVEARLVEKSWDGAPRTLLELNWRMG